MTKTKLTKQEIKEQLRQTLKELKALVDSFEDLIEQQERVSLKLTEALELGDMLEP